MMTTRRNGLGKGLGALIADLGTAVSVDSSERKDLTSGSKILDIDINDIKPNDMQPRTVFDEDAIKGLAESIQLHGVIQPVILRKGTNGYEIVAGERRWRAARKAGVRKIPAIVRELNEEENALFAIIENMQREDLTPIEEANAFKKMIDHYGLTQQELSKSIGKSRPFITNILRLLKLPKPVIDMISDGTLSAGHANALGSIKNEKVQIEAAIQIVREGLSVRQAEKMVAKLNDGGEKQIPRAKARQKNSDIKNIEEELTSIMGTKVRLETNGRNGHIEIHYYSRAELEGLIEDIRKLAKNR
jgi:ParB family chromosome partitioning protein